MDPRLTPGRALRSILLERDVEELRRLFGVARPARINERHPAPWCVKQVRDPRHQRSTVYDYVVLDARGHHVCETQDPLVAEAIAVAAQTIGEYPPR
jgi:hypothetical protein